MRNIKFRGYSKKYNGWEYGDLIQYDDREFYILDNYDRQWDILEAGVKVDKDSIGQFTGLKDVNDVEIYEGDILHIKGKGEIDYYPSDDEVEIEGNFTVYIDVLCGLMLVANKEYIQGAFIFNNNNFTVEIVGNTLNNKFKL